MGKAELIVWGDFAGAAHHQRGYSVAIQQKPSMGGGVANRYNPAVWQPVNRLPKVTLPCRVKGATDLISQPVSERIKISST